MTGWHHRCNGHELEQTLGDSDGQRRLACRNPQDHKESDMTGQLNNKTWTRSICKESRDQGKRRSNRYGRKQVNLATEKLNLKCL